MDADADQLQLYIFILERVSLHLLAKLLLLVTLHKQKVSAAGGRGYLRSFINKFHNNGYLKVFEVVKISRHTLWTSEC